jgi:hypothetical protein
VTFVLIAQMHTLVSLSLQVHGTRHTRVQHRDSDEMSVGHQETGWNVVNVKEVARQLKKEYGNSPYIELPDLKALTEEKDEEPQQ